MSRRALDEIGFCFLFAPSYHPGLKHAGPVRRALKVRTIMNVLGPCVNPAEPPVQLLGVADPRLLEPVAQALAALGVEQALVVHGGGLDEVALHGETEAVRSPRAAGSSADVIAPEQAGFERAPLAACSGRRPRGKCRAAEGAPQRLRDRRGAPGGGLQRRRPAAHRGQGGDAARRRRARPRRRSARPPRLAVLGAFVEVSHA